MASNRLLEMRRCGKRGSADLDIKRETWSSVQSNNIFATAPDGGKSPDSITSGNGSIWVEYGDGAQSDGSAGSSTVVQYDLLGNAQHAYTLPGLADGLKADPATGDVWALQNQDGNSTITLIDPATQQVSAPLSYAAPYIYGADSTRGYDDVAFVGQKVFLSYTNPVNPGPGLAEIAARRLADPHRGSGQGVHPHQQSRHHAAKRELRHPACRVHLARRRDHADRGLGDVLCVQPERQQHPGGGG